MSNAPEWIQIAGLIVIGIVGYAVVAWAYERLRPKKTDRGQYPGKGLDPSSGGEPAEMVTCPNPACRAPNQPYAVSCTRCGSRLERFV